MNPTMTAFLIAGFFYVLSQKNTSTSGTNSNSGTNAIAAQLAALQKQLQNQSSGKGSGSGSGSGSSKDSAASLAPGGSTNLASWLSNYVANDNKGANAAVYDTSYSPQTGLLSSVAAPDTSSVDTIGAANITALLDSGATSVGGDNSSIGASGGDGSNSYFSDDGGDDGGGGGDYGDYGSYDDGGDDGD